MSHWFFGSIVLQTVSGQAIDRHLLGLKLTALESGMNLPELFMDSTYQYALHFKVSTSQVLYLHLLLLSNCKLVLVGSGEVASQPC